MTKDNQPMPELLPCPFCGYTAKSEREPGWKWRVSCVNIDCDAVCRVDYPILDIEAIGGSKKLAEEAWNTRATPTDASGFDFQGALDNFPMPLVDAPPCIQYETETLNYWFGVNGPAVLYALTTMAKAKKEGV
jgi:hypothetical protein